MGEDIRERYAETLGLCLNGPASDGRGWFRSEAERSDCYWRADQLLAVRDEEVERLQGELIAARECITSLQGILDELTISANEAAIAWGADVAERDALKAVWNEWRARLGGSFPRAMVQEMDAALVVPETPGSES